MSVAVVTRVAILASATSASAAFATVTTAAESATPTTPATSAAAVTASPATETSVPGRALLTGARDVHRQRSPTEFLSVQHVDGSLGFFCGCEFDKRKAAGAACELVEHQIDIQDCACGGEMILKVSFHRLVGQIAHKKTVLVVHNTKAASNTAAGVLPGQTSDGETQP